jgi:hypothetical protein
MSRRRQGRAEGAAGPVPPDPGVTGPRWSELWVRDAQGCLLQQTRRCAAWYTAAVRREACGPCPCQPAGAHDAFGGITHGSDILRASHRLSGALRSDCLVAMEIW